MNASSLVIRARNIIRIIRTIRNWPDLFFRRFRGGSETVAHVRSGLAFALDVKKYEWFALAEIFLDEIYTKYHPIRDGDTVVDIGANIGGFSLYAARQTPRGRIIAYEPNPDTFGRFVRNIALNNAKNIVAVQEAVVGEGKRGDAQLFVEPTSSLSASLHAKFAGGRSVSVHAVTLASIFAAHQISRCDFLKLDCEGTETEIMMTAPQEILQRVDYIAMEYHSDPPQLTMFLERNGFSVRREKGNQFRAEMLYASHLSS